MLSPPVNREIATYRISECTNAAEKYDNVLALDDVVGIMYITNEIDLQRAVREVVADSDRSDNVECEAESSRQQTT
jgi:hypothetical protein